MKMLFFAAGLLFASVLMAETFERNLIIRWDRSKPNAAPQYAFSNENNMNFLPEDELLVKFKNLYWKRVPSDGTFFLASGSDEVKFQDDFKSVGLFLVHGPPYQRFYYGGPYGGVYAAPLPPPIPMPPPVYFCPPPCGVGPGPFAYPYPPVPPAVPYVPWGFVPDPSYFYFGFRVY